MWTVRPESDQRPDVHALIRDYFAELTVRYFRRPTDDAEIDLTLDEFPADGVVSLSDMGLPDDWRARLS